MGAGAGARLFRVILPVADIDRAQAFYEAVLAAAGERVSPGRHYIACGGVILALVDPRAEGDGYDARPNQDFVYFAVDDLEAAHALVRSAGARRVDAGVAATPWGERLFYAHDPFGNPICFVDSSTAFTGGLPG